VSHKRSSFGFLSQLNLWPHPSDDFGVFISIPFVPFTPMVVIAGWVAAVLLQQDNWYARLCDAQQTHAERAASWEQQRDNLDRLNAQHEQKQRLSGNRRFKLRPASTSSPQGFPTPLNYPPGQWWTHRSSRGCMTAAMPGQSDYQCDRQSELAAVMPLADAELPAAPECDESRVGV
jgi:hypothetical protein